MNKKELRAETARRRELCTARQAEEMSARIVGQILRTPQYIEAKTVFMYMSLPKEVQLRTLFDQSIRDGKEIAVPRVEGKQMHFYGVRSEHDLRVGVMGILEPDPSSCMQMDDREEALMILPGVAFDSALGRVGYGGGYYDRYLEAHIHHPTMAVAFSFQIFDYVPVQAHDIRPQLLFTENECICPR